MKKKKTWIWSLMTWVLLSSGPAQAGILFAFAMTRICTQDERTFASSVDTSPCLLATLTIAGMVGWTGTTLINDWGGKYRLIGGGIFVLDQPSTGPNFVQNLRTNLTFIDDQEFFVTLEHVIQEKLKTLADLEQSRGELSFSPTEIDTLLQNLSLTAPQRAQVLNILL